MGLGLHGGGLAVARWLAKNKAKVIITDLKNKNQLKNSINKLKGQLVTYHLGEHRVADFKKADIVIQNPAVSRQSRFIKIAAKAGVQIENEAGLFFKLHNPKKIIGITGTRGKSTVSTLLHQILIQKYKRIKLAGNIGSTAMFDIVDNLKKNDYVILELSSWHLENLGDQNLSPYISVITNIMPDHLNRYKGLKDYTMAKVNILKFQDREDIAVLNYDNTITKNMGKMVKGRRFWFSKKIFTDQNGLYLRNKNIYFRINGQTNKICSLSAIKIKGDHNIENVLAAITVAKILNVKNNQIIKALKEFRGVQYRLEFIRELRGVEYFNDTTSTIPEATIAALKSFTSKNIVLIAGGTDKKLNFKNLARQIKIHCQAVILFEGQGSNKIFNELKKIKFKSIINNVKTMQAAVGLAESMSKKSDVVLLSPACASFNLFVNEFDRGNQFNRVVSILK